MEQPLERTVHPGGRQTLGYLRNLFDERGIKPKSKLGQNFLIDLNSRVLLVRTAGGSKGDLVLEVGRGTGGLTSRLVEQAGAVLSVELDPAFFALASETLAGKQNLTLLHADVLRRKNE